MKSLLRPIFGLVLMALLFHSFGVTFSVYAEEIGAEESVDLNDLFGAEDSEEVVVAPSKDMSMKTTRLAVVPGIIAVGLIFLNTRKKQKELPS